MPCYDGRDIDTSQLRAEVDRLTRLLCQACQLLFRVADRRYAGFRELEEWYEAHKSNSGHG
jgi:hypothetical protein